MPMAILAVLFWVAVFVFVFWYLIRIGKKRPQLKHRVTRTESKRELEDDDENEEEQDSEDSEADGLMSLDEGEEMFPEE